MNIAQRLTKLANECDRRRKRIKYADRKLANAARAKAYRRAASIAAKYEASLA